MRLVVISDTHGEHASLGPLHGDVLIHCGDMAATVDPDERPLEALDAWFGAQDFQLVLAIGGNWDFALQQRLRRGRPAFRNAHCLLDDSVTFGGVRFYGSPWTPALSRWAFYLPDAEMARRWDAIPDDTDVLITHTPPRGVLDQNRRGDHLGCRALAARLPALRCALHVFGHTHASYGVREQGGRWLANASSMGSHDGPLRPPLVFEVTPGPGGVAVAPVAGGGL